MTTLLVDADILVYRCAAAGETKVDWGDGGEVCRDAGDIAEAYGALKHHVGRLQDAAGASRAILCVSGAGNWRTALWPAYKAHRKPANRPIHIDALRAMIVADGGYQRPLLEADDILGILATHPKIIPGRKIIWSVDKDLRQIPGLHLEEPDKVVEVAERDADYWHLTQTLTGDSTDGYPGLPGVGPKKAEGLLFGASPPFGTWPEAWGNIVAAFEAKGLTEADALVQARVARILRHTDYCFNAKEPILWTPPRHPPR
jgi:DNA polymerase-1